MCILNNIKRGSQLSRALAPGRLPGFISACSHKKPCSSGYPESTCCLNLETSFKENIASQSFLSSDKEQHGGAAVGGSSRDRTTQLLDMSSHSLASNRSVQEHQQKCMPPNHTYVCMHAHILEILCKNHKF